jgi:hypothetical protein
MFGIECLFSRLAKSEIADFTFVNEQFSDKRNAENSIQNNHNLPTVSIGR